MKEHFVTYEQALALNDLGFKEPCIATIDQTEYFHIKGTKQFPRGAMMYYTIDLPLKSQVFEWGRKEYDLYHMVHQFEHHKDTPRNSLGEVSGKLVMLNDDISYFSYHSTYEEAESACIDKLIEIIKNK